MTDSSLSQPPRPSTQASSAHPRAEPGGPLDLVIRGGTVYDGTGSPGTQADVGVRDDRIVAVGAIDERGGVELDASGLAVSPGFIDVHSHEDYAVLLEPLVPFKVLQGVTTVIVGNCGSGVTPFTAGQQQFCSLHLGANPAPWDGLNGYFDRVGAVGPSLNVAALVGHGSLRRGALQLARRPPTSAELGRMRGWLIEGLAAGAVGLSSGLVYEPGCYAATDELVDLVRELALVGGIYTSHIRNEGAGLVQAIDEAIHIGEQAGGVPVQISHHKAVGRGNWGLVSESLHRIEQAGANGLRVTADQYPYTAASTWFEAVIQQDALTEDSHGGLGGVRAADILIASSPCQPAYEGRTLDELTREWNLPVAQAADRLLAEVGRELWVVLFSMDEADVRKVLAHPSTMIGSDGLPTSGKPHPRLYGTFPRVLGRYVREQRLLDLPTAIHKMTGLPAATFRLPNRGVIRLGAFADLVVFDPERVIDQATYFEPALPPAGIRAVYVNGRAVALSGGHTGTRPGRVLRRAS